MLEGVIIHPHCDAMQLSHRADSIAQGCKVVAGAAGTLHCASSGGLVVALLGTNCCLVSGLLKRQHVAHQVLIFIKVL
jgi:O-antigen ligase